MAFGMFVETTSGTTTLALTFAHTPFAVLIFGRAMSRHFRQYSQTTRLVIVVVAFLFVNHAGKIIQRDDSGPLA